jgi:hypothetical protein
MATWHEWARNLYGERYAEAGAFRARVDAEAERRRQPIEERVRRVQLQIVAELERLNAEAER